MDERFTPDRAVDGDPATLGRLWDQIELVGGRPRHPADVQPRGDPRAFGRVREFSCKCGRSAWRTFHRATTIGENCEIAFRPLRASVHLNSKTTDVRPFKFQLFQTPN